MNVLLIYLTNLFYRYNKKKELTKVQEQEQTASLQKSRKKITMYE